MAGWTAKETTVRDRPRFGGRARLRANAQVAQLVEHVTENHGVGGSIPPLGTTSPNFAETDLVWASNLPILVQIAGI